ncbi:polyphenol oxidase [Striga asiatica]|uniref:Polyphenol oxidase n=1 Tax=Striga asiatica TaxID=4170 RepID=A0A5A7R9H3_STRAF|nr:polyphenol oxidase [Striga asiatica]
MSSLHSPSPAILPTTTTTTARRLLPTKPSHFLSRPPPRLPHHRHHNLHVSCKTDDNNHHDNPPPANPNRRNILLRGLGGGMSAAAAAAGGLHARADPIQAPEFSACGLAHDVQSGDLLDVNCCPPISDTIIDYTLPRHKPHLLRVRPPAHRLTKDYLAKFEEAVRRMKALDRSDPSDPRGFTQQANIHCAYCNGAHDQPGHPNLDIQVHNSWLFFPFHRWYLYFYERILGEMIDDPTFALPFWNWDNPKGMQMPLAFDNPNSPLYDSNRNQSNRPPAIIDLGLTGVSDDLQKVVNNLTVMYGEMVRSVNSTLDFMGQPYHAGDQPHGGAGMGSSERGSHVAAHVWVGDFARNKYGEDMGNFYSAGRDTLFYSHHANVDRMWATWKTLKTDVPKEITDPDYLNASFLFYDEKKRLVRVKVADCLDHRKMGYDYEKVDIPWLNYRPSKKAARAKIQKISPGAEKADEIFPLKLKKTTRVLVHKSRKGKADEVLVLEGIETDSTKFVKFDVFVNDEDDGSDELDKAEYAGTFAQVPHKNRAASGKSNITLRLTELYEDIDVDDDDTVVVTLVPRSNGESVTIGGIKIIPSPPRSG